MPYLDPSQDDDFPAMSVEMDALSLLVEAYIMAEGPKKGQRLLVSAGKLLDLREQKAERIVDFLPPAKAAEREKLRRTTRAWFRKNLPRWLSALDMTGKRI